MAKILSRYRLPAATVAKIEKIRKRLGAKSTAVAVERAIAAFDLNAPVLANAQNVVIKNVAKGPTIALSVDELEALTGSPYAYAKALDQSLTKVIFNHAQKKPDATLTLRVAPNRQ